jgi:predicted MFS family arabinose efflux permease
MSHAVGVGSYRAVLALPFALRTFVPAIAGRLAYGLFPLATLFTVQQATDSYTTAGLAAAGFGITAVTMPFKARLADRHSQRTVLPPQALACAAALIGACLVTDPMALIALLTAAGLAAPPLGPAMRANWRRLTEGTSLKPRAYGLDSVTEETLYLIGPLIAGLLVAVGPARWALALTAALLVAGTLGMVAAPPARHREPRAALKPSAVSSARAPAATARGRLSSRLRTVDLGPLRLPALRRLLAVILAVGAGTSVVYTCLAVTAQDHGKPGAAGLLEAAFAVGSVTGGLLWARRDHSPNHRRQLALLLGVLAAGLTVASVAPGLVTLGLVLCVTGTAMAPVYVVAYLAADDLAGKGSATEAGTWVNVATNAGSAAGAALAGIIAQSWGAGPGFLIGAALLAVTAGAVALRGENSSARPKSPGEESLELHSGDNSASRKSPGEESLKLHSGSEQTDRRPVGEPEAQPPILLRDGGQLGARGFPLQAQGRHGPGAEAEHVAPGPDPLGQHHQAAVGQGEDARVGDVAHVLVQGGGEAARRALDVAAGSAGAGSEAAEAER